MKNSEIVIIELCGEKKYRGWGPSGTPSDPEIFLELLKLNLLVQGFEKFLSRFRKISKDLESQLGHLNLCQNQMSYRTWNKNLDKGFRNLRDELLKLDSKFSEISWSVFPSEEKRRSFRQLEVIFREFIETIQFLKNQIEEIEFAEPRRTKAL